MTDNALASFKIEDAASKLRDHIKLAFVEMLDDEQWNALIDQEFKKFTTDAEGDGLYSKPSPSPLSAICHLALSELAKDKIAEVLKSDDWNTKHGSVIPNKIKELIVDKREEMVGALLESMMGRAASQMLGSVAVELDDFKHRYRG